MSGRPPLRIPGHRPLTRPEDRDRPFAEGYSGPRGGRDPRLGPPARCLSRGARGHRSGVGVPPVRAASDAVAARENALRRLLKLADSHAQAQLSFAEVRREVIDSLLTLRILSLEVVEAIERWRASGSATGSGLWPCPTTGDSYLLRLKDDTRWLADSPLGEILKFTPKSDPFFIVPSARETEPAAPTNQMTPTLQARRPRTADGMAVLPLQASLLRRIRSAEHVIIKESVQARMRSGGVQEAESRPGSAAAFAPMPAPEKATPTPMPAPAPVPAAVPAAPAPAPAPVPAVQGRLPLAAPRVRPVAVLPEQPGATLRMEPMNLVSGPQVKEAYDDHVAKCDPRLVKTFEPWESLEKTLNEVGPEAPEWFWLYDCSAPSGAEPVGLAVFRLNRNLSTHFGQLLHLTVRDSSRLEDAVDVVKWRIFGLLPVKSIRTTLWCQDIDGTLEIDKDIAKIFKGKYFRWFSLNNLPGGRRGQVFNRPRGDPPLDPEFPSEVPSIEVCLGQAWMRGARNLDGMSPGSCTWSLVLAAACLRHVAARDREAAEQAAGANVISAAATAAREVAKEGLVRSLLMGDLEALLVSISPVNTQADNKGASGMGPTAIVASLAKTLEANGAGVPGVVCEHVVGVNEAATLARKGVTAEGFKDAIEGLGCEQLAAQIEAAQPQDLTFGRLYVTFDWAGASVLDAAAGTFEVPVHAAGACSIHPHPVFYVATSEDDVFAVVVPWEGPNAPPLPAEDAVFAACTDIIQKTEPMASSPFPALHLSSFDVRYASRIIDIAKADTLGMPTDQALQVAEFSSMSVGAGPDRPGKLRSPASMGAQPFVVRRPFAVCFFHTDMDSLNVPLAAALLA